MISPIDVSVMPAHGSGHGQGGVDGAPFDAVVSRRTPGARSRPDGFTLIELAVVLAIMGLMLALVLAHGPMRSPTLQTRAAAAQVAQGLRSARARAIAL